MKTHQSNPRRLANDHFIPGAVEFLVPGNHCRLLDRRRTPGRIISIDMDGGFFRWEISDFEDRGKHWDVTFERVETYQFEIGAERLAPEFVERMRARIQILNRTVEVNASTAAFEKNKLVLSAALAEAAAWLRMNSVFFSNNTPIDFQNRVGPAALRNDFNRYLESKGLAEIELVTAETQVLNPNSGDWMKAMQIVMAEMGLKPYRGGQIRAERIFEGLGSRENRSRYIINRLGFVRACFEKLGLTEVELYRGMSTDAAWRPATALQYRFWSSWTFSRKVAEDFTDFDPGSRQKNSYLIKRAIPVEKLFMTYLETDAFNNQYAEAEAIVLHDEDDRALW